MPFLFRQNMRGCAGPGGHGPGPGPGWLPAGILFLVILLAAGDAGAVGRIDRQGVYVLGGWFQYGVIQGESRYGLDFSNGPGYSVHFRYNMSRRTALAIYFDNQSFSAQTGATALYADSSRAALDQLKLTTAHAGIRFFSVPPGGDVLRYAEITAGFYRPEIQFPKTQQTSIGQDVG